MASGGAGAGKDGVAINFTGTTGTNTLELQAGYNITGLVKGAAGTATNIFVLGGGTNASFDVSGFGVQQYLGFNSFQLTAQNDTTVWKLTGSTIEATPWNLNKGVLSVDANGQLGSNVLSSPLTFNGGTLQVRGTAFNDFGARVVTWGAAGGGFDIQEPANTFTVSQDLTGGSLKVNPVAG